jgi:thioredoxin 1
MMKILKFHATWCQPCKALSKVIEEAKDNITMPIEEIDIDNNMDLVKMYGVRGVPVLVLVDEQGKAIRTKTGTMNEKQLMEFLNG